MKRFAPAILVLIVLISAVGCQPGQETLAPTPASTTPAIAPSVEPDASEAATFQNPVIERDFPDPGITLVDDTYFAYSTNASGRNVPAASSTDLINWTFLGDVMPALPSWAMLGGSFIWAPEVIEINGRYNLYFTARDKAADRQCIGVAVSDKPEGKFRDEGAAALVCQVDEGGSIDASPFRDADGTLYLYWKNDGNCCSQPTYLYVQELSDDGLSLLGEPTRLIRNEHVWERHVIEAPTMWLQDGRYYLFFSGNDYSGPPYAVGYATCETAVGPCEAAPENPILSSQMEGPPLVIGPGHQTIVRGPNGELWLAYHVWQVTTSGTRGNSRFMWLDRLDWQEGKPIIIGPTTDPQAVP